MQAQAVKKLRLVWRHQTCQAGCFADFRIRLIISHRQFRHRLQHCHTLQQRCHVFKCGRCAQPIETQRFRRLHHGAPVVTGQRIDQPEHIAAVHAAQHGAHTHLIELAGAKRDGLVGERQRIAHGAACRSRQQAQSLRFSLNVFDAEDLHQMLHHGFRRHRPQVELQAT